MIKEIENRRSIRKFSKEDIPQEIIEEILTAGINAPSSKNRQPWKFIVLRGKSKKEMLKVFSKGIKHEEKEPLLPNSSEHLSGAKNTLEIMKEAPICIFVVNTLGLDISKQLSEEDRFFESANTQSIGAAIQNILLEAESKGLGSLWICDIFFAYKELKEWLNEGEIVAAISIGKPLESPLKRPRKALKDTVIFKN